ncbi:hypothetical protein GCM10011519_24660 [Marmoricola endophyticus]|uniref:Catalase n=1 Tax=Marmoricola endophyticus TaxID=2040280 RepID=A0A917BNB2_9ACTN|nr:catalase family protein [Marmoricola endophyticus]GGF49770.1 hypothetical protein GCM10011519_24660 [Marmoricola endophyticus]
MPTPIRYSKDIEQLQDDEAAVIAETIELMRATMEKAFDQHRHAASGTHAKSHGVATGTLTVADDLPPELAQGMFAAPASYEVVLRLASEPGQIDPDTAARARGAALKVLGVPGEKLEPGWPSQDWLFNTWPVIPDGDATTYLTSIRQREKHAGHHLLTDVTTVAKQRTLDALLFERTPNIHPLAHTYYTQSAFRYGDHVAKLRLTPATGEMRALGGREVSRSDPPDVLHRWVREFMAERAARFDLEVQLCVDLNAMPVEDAAVEWSEELSPYRRVGVVELPAQETFSPARRVYADDRLGGRPWNGLVAHRPLGSINRVRKQAYDELGRWRFETNAITPSEPRTLAEIPD